MLGEPALPDIVVPSSLARSPGILGSSPALRRVLTLAAATRRSVLISGETGAGEERLARTLRDSRGRTGDYVVDSCAELVESELFGQEKGSFTGATATSRGLAMAAADRGTLFLDEDGELVLPQQAKLLPFLQNPPCTTRDDRPMGQGRRRMPLPSAHSEKIQSQDAMPLAGDILRAVAIPDSASAAVAA